jgi:hypothetical protein
VYSSTFPNPGIDDDVNATTKKVVPGTSAEFSANVSELITDVTYYVRAYVTNNKGTVYGESVRFTPGASQDVVVLHGANLMVLRQDLGTASNYSTARSLCGGTKSGYSDWRLPTAAELSTLYTQRDAIGGFKSDWYWSSTSCGSYDYTQINFSNNGGTGCYSDKANVRCVRTLE